MTDGAAGNLKPALALADALARTQGETPDSTFDSERIDVSLRAPWSWLAPRLRVGMRFGVSGPLARRMNGPFPDLLIGAGRRAALASIAVRQASARQTFTIQLLDPRIDPRHFDVVVCPRHDALQGENVLTTVGSLHDVTDQTLARWREQWTEFEALPGPRVALLIGGPSRTSRFDPEQLEALIDGAERVIGDQGTLFVTTSRRTPEGLASRLRERFQERAWLAEDFEENPYGGFLAWAEHLFVTPDSVNMLSEALGTGAPVYTLSPLDPRPRLARFHAHLREEGLVHEPGEAPVTADHPPLREAAAIAAIIRRRWPND